VALDGKPSGGHKRGRAEARGRSSAGGGRERGENPRPSALDKAAPAWAAAATDGDRCLRALHHERGHRVVTGSVASEVGTVKGTRG
jgi:hypothetical protein